MSTATVKKEKSPYGLRYDVRWSFSRSRRFRVARASSADYLPLPNGIASSRSPSFGYGQRWQPLNEKGRDAPPSTAYSTKSCFDLHIAGPAFKRPERELSRPYVPQSMTPGPGSYSPTLNLGDSPKFTMLPRRSEKRDCETPPPGSYSPRRSLVDNQRFCSISFGIGDRPSPAKRSPIPGPGTYSVPPLFPPKSLSRQRPYLRKRCGP